MRLHSLATVRTPLRRIVFLFVAFIGLIARPVRATPIWQNGDVITYPQALWPLSPAGTLLLNDFQSVYASASALLVVGLPTPGFSMTFDGAIPVIAYLPQSSSPASLNQNLVDPTSTSSGEFGGDVVALKLNIDFSDAGFLLGSSGLRFGDLVLENFGPLSLLNGRTVRQILGADETALGGTASFLSIADLDLLTVELNAAFDGGSISSGFAQDHLVAPSAAPAPVPEPATLTLMAVGLAGVASRHRRKRSHRA